ncbi:uncharacterized protein LOC128390893 [Panonychus citri]|uniref:uncharacterized protein LOC128390893 n=1 Tax=Panonychus citri TaxID=50023 RepID=UPI00230820A2|nr:uncharacterized protein LOC128390893 [Panonychus citri]
MSLSGDNVDILGDMYYKFLVHDCMWSGGTCKEDNTHETTNKFSDFSYFSTSPVYGSIFDIFNIDDENSLGEINCDPEYDTSDQDDSPLSGLSAEDTEPVEDDNNLLNPSCSSSPTPSTSSSISTLTGSTIITPTGLPVAADCSIIKPTTSRATLTGKSTGSNKSTLSSKATKSASSKVNSVNSKLTLSAAAASTSTARATTSTANSLVTPTISPIATISPTSIANSPIISTTTTTTTTNNLTPSTSSVTPTAAIPINANLTVASNSSSSSSILKSTGKARNPKSLYPERRKEHNNSEKKRRDHLRNAFNHLRDQIPKLKDGEKKAARVTILKESVSYVTLLKEKHRYLERTKNAETIKHENLLKRLKMLQSSTGASISFNNNNNSNINNNNNNNDLNVVYVQCNSSTVC